MKPLLSRGFTVCGVGSSGYFRVSGIGASRSSKACRWVGVGIASRSKPDWSWPATRRWLRVRGPRWSSRVVELGGGWWWVVVLVAALWSAFLDRLAGAAG